MGNGGGRYYIMSSKYSKGNNGTVGYVRDRDIDALRHQELVMQLAQAKDEITRSDVVDLLHVTPSQAYRILQRLKGKGLLLLEGKGAGSKYHTAK
jgi:ATP-dependent DNA helicase RecG